MGIKVSQLPVASSVAVDDYLPILDTSENILKRTDPTKLDNARDLTQAEYDALTPEQKASGTYYITDAPTTGVTVDSALSTTSTNPVENRVIKQALDSINDPTTTHVSGNPISIRGLLSNQLAVNPIITFEPIQAGSGTPSPSNIRAISGYDKIEVLSCGKNLIDESTYQVGDAAHGTMAKAFSQSDNRPYLAAGTKFVLSINGSGSGVAWISVSQKPNSSDLSEFLVIDFISSRRFSSDNPIIGTMPVSGYLAFSIQDIGGDLNVARAMKLMLEIGETSTTYVPYNKTTDLSESLGQTVYAGTYNPRTGIFTATHAKKRMEGNDTFNGSNPGTNAQLTIGAMKPADTTNDPCTVCDTLEKSQGLVTGKTTIFIGGGVSQTTYIYNMSLIDPSINSSQTLNAYFAQHPVEFTYPLLNPIEIQLTPHEISLLKDYAYVSTNGTSIALDYHNGELASLADVSQLGETVNELGDNLNTKINTNIASAVSGILSQVAKKTTGTLPANGSITMGVGTGKTVSLGFARVYLLINSTNASRCIYWITTQNTVVGSVDSMINPANITVTLSSGIITVANATQYNLAYALYEFSI